MRTAKLSKGLAWACAVAGASALAVTLTGGTAFAGGASSAAASWSGKLKNNTVVTVTGKHWVAGDTLAIAECNGTVVTSMSEAACDVSNAVTSTATTKGKIPTGTTLTFATGTVGNGTCDKGQTCYIVVIDLTQYENGQTPDDAAAPVVVNHTD